MWVNILHFVFVCVDLPDINESHLLQVEHVDSKAPNIVRTSLFLL